MTLRRQAVYAGCASKGALLEHGGETFVSLPPRTREHADKINKTASQLCWRS